VEQGKATVLLAASVFHFRTYSVQEVKEYLQEKNVDVNL